MIAQVGTGRLDGAGTAGTVPLWDDIDTLLDSIITQNSGVIEVGGDLDVTGAVEFSAVGSGAVGTLNLASTSPILIFDRTNAATNERLWNISAGSNVLAFQTKLDDGTVSENWLAVTRSGGAVTEVKIFGPVVVPETIAVTGVATFTAAPVFSSATASLPMFTNGSKALVSNAMTGTGSVVMSASPTGTGTWALPAVTVASTAVITGLITATAGILINGGSAAAGKIYKDSTIGLGIRCITGSVLDLWVTQPDGTTIFSVPTGTNTFAVSAKLTVGAQIEGSASTTARATLRIPHGTAPTAPVNGDMWTTTAGAFIRINGVTKTFTLT